MTTRHNAVTSPAPGDLTIRHQTIAGLRALADFLEANPSVPVNEHGHDLHFFTRDLDDASAAALVDRTAELLGVDVQDHTDWGGNYIAVKNFGRVSYRVVHVPAHIWDEHNARHSYTTNVVYDAPDQDGDASERAA